MTDEHEISDDELALAAGGSAPSPTITLPSGHTMPAVPSQSTDPSYNSTIYIQVR